MADSKNNLSENPLRTRKSWINKFQNAGRGVILGVTGQSSFAFHLIATVAVIVLGTVAGLAVDRWCMLIICIGAVLAAEMFNSALESMGRVITNQFDPNMERALDIASGAVLIVATTAAITGALIFLEAFTKLGSGTV